MSNNQSMLSANQAAKRWSKSRNTIKKDIENGTLSASKGENGGYLIQITEMLRVYGEPAQTNAQKPPESTPEHAQETVEKSYAQSNDLQNKLKLYAQEVQHLRQRLADAEQQASKAERRLENAEDQLKASIESERKLTQQVTALLTHQQEETTKKKRKWWQLR